WRWRRRVLVLAFAAALIALRNRGAAFDAHEEHNADGRQTEKPGDQFFTHAKTPKATLLDAAGAPSNAILADPASGSNRQARVLGEAFQPGGGAGIGVGGRLRAFERRKEAVGHLFPQLDAPLVERVDPRQ